MAEKKVSWLELFFDLVFVTAVSFTTHLLLEIDHHPERLGLYLGEYFLMIFPMFWLWTGQTMLINRFGEHLKRPELFMLPQMFFFILMTASLDFEFSHTYHAYLAGYLGLRVLTVIQYFLVARRLEGPSQEVAELLARNFIPGLLLPLASLLFIGRGHYIVMYSGMALDLILPIFYRRRLRSAPVNLPHLAERFGLFVLITFGESLVSITSLLVGRTGQPDSLLFSLAGFLLIALLWSSYFYAYENVADHHRRTNGQLLLYGHFLILSSVMLLAGGLELLAEGRLPSGVLSAFLYGPALLFFISQSLVFYYHRQKARPFHHLAQALGLLPLPAAWALNFYFSIPPLVNLLILNLGALLQNILQRGWHLKIFS